MFTVDHRSSSLLASHQGHSRRPERAQLEQFGLGETSMFLMFRTSRDHSDSFRGSGVPNLLGILLRFNAEPL